MPTSAAPLFRPDIIRRHLAGFTPPANAEPLRATLGRWAELLSGERGQRYRETELLADFLTHVFVEGLGYAPPVARDAEGRYTFTRESHVEVDGKFADAVLGDFSPAGEHSVVAVEGKGPRDPLDRPFAGRKMSAVDQAYRYAINLPCDWIVVTNLREVRLYHKGSTQKHYERFVVADMAADSREVARFVYILGAERVVPRRGRSHLHELLAQSNVAGEALTHRYYEEYATTRRDVFAMLRRDNPGVAPELVLAATQKLLDRVLFIAFAEDRGLLPEHTLARAYQHHDPYNPRPVWENFKGLFRAIDLGSPQLGIAAYDGGLFAIDYALDGLRVSDEACGLLKHLGDYDYSPPAPEDALPAQPVRGEQDAGDGADLVDVEILGHIFEQSITDLEKLRGSIAEANGAEADGAGVVSRRRREGAFYTASFITRFLVAEALTPALEERFERLRARHAAGATGTAPAALADPRAYVLEDLNRPQRQALVDFWEAWLTELETVRVVDPACGSGAFLIEAFDQLHPVYERAVEHLEELRGMRSLFDPDRTILQNNLYGVDLNEEAVEICRLSIWIKTAQRGKALTDLDHNIRAGNSVVSDPAVHPKALDWRAAFPEVFAAGGFDAVVGNPPYVRAELLTPFKPHWESRFDAFHGSADLYVYFYELGLDLLRPGGRLAFVVTNKWLKTGYARPLRALFAEQTWVERVADLGHAREVFPDADVFPSLMIFRKPPADGEATSGHASFKACVIPRELVRAEDLATQVTEGGFSVPRDTLTGDPWILDPPAVGRLMAKMRGAGVPLPEYLGVEPQYGIKTGYNEAFLIDAQTRDGLIRDDPRSAEIIRPCLRGQEIDRWVPEWGGEWMIFARRGVDIDAYPAVRRHLEQHRERLEPRPEQWPREERWSGRKAGSYAWYELQDTVDYWESFERPKLVHTDIAWRPEFAFVEGPMYPLNTVYVWPTADLYVLGVLNAPLLWWYSWRNAQHGKDEALRLFSTFTKTIPVPRPAADLEERVVSNVRALLDVTKQRHAARHELIEWLRFEFGVEVPGQKLLIPEALDADAFVAEVRKRRPSGRRSVTPAELRRLREAFEESAGRLRALTLTAAGHERTISDDVMVAYGLTAEEQALVWNTAPPRTPLASEEEAGAAAE